MPFFSGSEHVLITGGKFYDTTCNTSSSCRHRSTTPSISGVDTAYPLSLSQSDSDIFAEELLVKKHGYPIWRPDPRCWGDHISPEYISSGVRIGDVGVVTQDGSIPDDFSPLTWLQSNIRSQDLKHGPHTVISSPGILRQEILPSLSQGLEGGLGGGYAFRPSSPGTIPELVLTSSKATARSAEFKFTSQSSRGAILVLPGGGSSIELLNLGEIRRYIERNAISWYRHINGKLGREIPNGSLYVITGFDKCASWGKKSELESCHL